MVVSYKFLVWFLSVNHLFVDVVADFSNNREKKMLVNQMLN